MINPILARQTMMALSSFQGALCLLDKVLPLVYMCLSLVAIASFAIPFLNDLASHGKTIRSPADALINNTTWYHQILHGEAFLVPKRFFLHFYITGILCTVGLYLYVKSIDNQSNQNSVALTLLLIHLTRRCWECLYVHVWRPTSKMHLAGYFLGMVHYVLLPVVFMDTRSVCEEVSLDADSVDWPIAVVGALTCLWAQYQQYRHHYFLAELRVTTKDGKTSQQDYKIPSKGWFHYVSCPHYTAEILIYMSFALVLLSRSSGKSNHKPLPLLLWVATNLSVSAIKSHDWYLLHYPEYASLQRTAIIPFLF